MKKRTFLSLIAIMLCTMLLASCGRTTSGGAGEKLELTVWNTQGTDFVYRELKEDLPSNWLTERTGVSVQNIYGNDGGQWDAKLTKLVVGNNLPDIIWCQASQGPSHFNKLKDLDKLALLTDDMLKEHAPNIWKRTPTYIWDQFRTEDGKIMGIPFEINSGDLDTVFYDYTEEERARLLNMKTVPRSRLVTTLSIRDDILKMIYPDAKSYDELVALLAERNEPIGEELILPIKTPEEFKEFMYKIRDLNIVENGKKVYAFGYAGDGNDNWEALCYLGNMMYGSGNHEYTAHWNDKTETIEVPLMQDHVKEMARAQNEMILDMVIDPESMAHTTAQFKAKIFQGQYAICSASRAGNLDTINQQIDENGGKFHYRPLYVDIPAPEGYAPFKVVNAFSSSFCMLNTLSEEQVIQVLKWADLQYTDEFMEILVWGTKEAGLYTENADGTRTFNDDRFNKFFIDGQASALEVSETKGLNRMGSRFILVPFSSSKWTADVHNKVTKLAPSTSSGFKFKSDKEQVTSVKAAPPCQAYASEFANIPEVVEYWAHREEWETAAKKAIAAPKGQFDTKWEDMKTVVNDIVDISAMEKNMTEVALEYWKDIKAANK